MPLDQARGWPEVEPEVAILGADQKERGLWGRECLCQTELKNDCACVTYGQSAGRRRENLDSSKKFLM